MTLADGLQRTYLFLGARRVPRSESMRSMKWLLAALILTTVAACGDQHTASSPANRIDERHTEFGDFGYSDIYRYYGGPSAVSQQSDAQRQADRHMTERR